MTTLSSHDVDHIAVLAQLQLTTEEQERFSEQLSSVLSFASALEDVAGVDSAAGSAEVGVLREDVVQETELTPEEVHASAAQVRDGYISAPHVFSDTPKKE